MAKAGRPRALDDSKLREICALVTAGFGLPGAAEYVGCAASTVRREAQRNLDFQEKLRKAQLASELDPLNSIRQSARSNWRAAAWYLERTNPQKYAKRNPMTLTPAEVKEFTETLANLISSEVRHPAVQKRIIRKMLELTGDTEIDGFPITQGDSLEDLVPENFSKQNVNSGY